VGFFWEGYLVVARVNGTFKEGKGDGGSHFWQRGALWGLSLKTKQRERGERPAQSNIPDRKPDKKGKKGGRN